tara:strand:- start:1025 stop:1444 length:420 start_codon:yes stop_codon:yes gene_type:complete
MIEKFNGIIYLVIFIIHFGMLAFYAAQLLVGTKKFMDKFGIDHTAAFMIRFLGAFFLGWILMALYIMFVRPNGVEGTWSFFNLLVITHLIVAITNFYSKNISKLGVTDKFTNEGIIVPFILLIMSSVLVYGLSDKIYLS